MLEIFSSESLRSQEQPSCGFHRYCLYEDWTAHEDHVALVDCFRGSCLCETGTVRGYPLYTRPCRRRYCWWPLPTPLRIGTCRDAVNWKKSSQAPNSGSSKYVTFGSLGRRLIIMECGRISRSAIHSAMAFSAWASSVPSCHCQRPR